MQIAGEEEHLHDQQRWCGGEQEAGVSAAQISERHDIIDAGRKQNEQDPELDQGIVGNELEEDPDDERDHGKVRREQSCKKAQIAQSLAKFGKRDLKEGREQHDRECGIDHRFERPRAGKRERDQHADSHRREVHSNLLLFEGLSNASQPGQPFAASHRDDRDQATK